MGYDVVLGNWRGVYAPSGITPEQRSALTAMVTAATQTKTWIEALDKNRWTPALLTGKAFDDFVDADGACGASRGFGKLSTNSFHGVNIC